MEQDDQRYDGVLASPVIQARLEGLGPARRNWLARAALWQPGAGGVLTPTRGAGFPPGLWLAIIDELLAIPGRDAQALSARFDQIALRADSRRRAGTRGVTATLPVEVLTRQEPYAQFAAVEVYELRHGLFSGGQSDVLNRLVMITGDACVVLPYDPRHDRVLLISQFRPGCLARGDLDPWLIETVAGRIDAGETPEQCARREALEEAGIALDELISLPGQYPSPALQSEYVYGFIGIADLPEAVPGIGGLPEEDEDIHSFTMDFRAAMALIETGEIRNGPLLVALLSLSQRRDAIRARFGLEDGARGA